MTTTQKEVTWDQRAEEIGKSAMASIAEMVDDLVAAREGEDSQAIDEAEQRIHEDPLSIQVREGWKSPGHKGEIEEFEILLSTGGPASRIIGQLGQYNEPDRPRLQVQDWFKPWTDVHVSDEDREKLLMYCQQFYFGE